jgi:hypothetical protein
MRQKRNLLNRLDLVGYLGDRVRKYRLDLGVERRGLGRLRCASFERGARARSEPRREEARRGAVRIRYSAGRTRMLEQRDLHD